MSAAVREYNLALVRAYLARDPGVLNLVATEDERERVGTIVFGLAQRGLTLDARQEEFAVESVRTTTGEQAELVAAETWWYRHIDALGREGQAARRVRYLMKYRLVRRVIEGQSRWNVDRLEDLGSNGVSPPA